MRKNQNKATPPLTAPAPPAHFPMPQDSPVAFEPWPLRRVDRVTEIHFTGGETEDQRGAGPWSRSSKSEGGDLSAGLLPPGLTSGSWGEWALPRGLAGPREQLWGRPGKARSWGCTTAAGGDVSHFPCDPEPQTKAGRELFSEGGLSVGPREPLEGGRVPPPPRTLHKALLPWTRPRALGVRFKFRLIRTHQPRLDLQDVPSCIATSGIFASGLCCRGPAPRCEHTWPLSPPRGEGAGAPSGAAGGGLQ